MAERAIALAGDPLCWWGCGRPATTAEHLIPVSALSPAEWAAVGGPHRDNIVPACGPCNYSRRANADWRPMDAETRLPLTVTVGAPASGKTTWARAQDALVFSLDDFRAPGEWTTAKHEHAIRQLVRQLKPAASRDPRAIVVDSTASGAVWRHQLRLIALRARRPLRLAWFDTPLEVCLARNGQRPDGCPPELIHRVHRQLAADRPRVLAERWTSTTFPDWRAPCLAPSSSRRQLESTQPDRSPARDRR